MSDIKQVKVYGAGNAFKDFMAIRKPHIEVIACYSAMPAEENHFNIPVVNDLSKFVAMPADVVVLALRDVATARRSLLEAGETGEILSLYCSGDADLQARVEHDSARLNELLDLGIRRPAISNMWVHPTGGSSFDTFDWVRNTAFELMAGQIAAQQLAGAVAELGVYRGDQARIISILFPQRVFYLFDTFEGFSRTDLLIEDGRFSASTTQDFADTSLEEVLAKIENRERLVVRKGYFPQTTVGLEDEFCFVSLDVDLYAPTLAGLEYFYPRLVKGGAVFVHDYNNARYKGVRSAVDEFHHRTHCTMLPIPDTAGSIVILK